MGSPTARWHFLLAAHSHSPALPVALRGAVTDTMLIKRVYVPWPEDSPPVLVVYVRKYGVLDSAGQILDNLRST